MKYTDLTTQVRVGVSRNQHIDELDGHLLRVEDEARSVDDLVTHSEVKRSDGEESVRPVRSIRTTPESQNW